MGKKHCSNKRKFGKWTYGKRLPRVDWETRGASPRGGETWIEQLLWIWFLRETAGPKKWAASRRTEYPETGPFVAVDGAATKQTTAPPTFLSNHTRWASKRDCQLKIEISQSSRVIPRALGFSRYPQPPTTGHVRELHHRTTITNPQMYSTHFLPTIKYQPQRARAK